MAVAPQYQIGSYPDAVVGTEAMEAVEEKYKAKYALGVCNSLKTLAPDVFQREFGGDMATCVYRAGAYADLNFDTWKIKWPTALAGRIGAFK